MGSGDDEGRTHPSIASFTFSTSCLSEKGLGMKL